MLRKRVITALILVPVLLAIIIAGPYWGFPVLVLAGTSLGLWEFAMLTPLKSDRAKAIASVLLGTSMAGVLIASPGNLTPTATLATATILAFIIHMIRPHEVTAAGERLISCLAGIMYAGFLPVHMAWLYNTTASDGWRWVLTVLFLTWVGDTAAYFVGKAVGKHKLYPLLSPKKTWEGAIAGMIGSVATVFVVRSLFFTALSPIECVLIGLPASILGQLGDFAESLLKRSAGVKDSGTLFPGHGGMLDRLDALLFATPYVYYFAIWAHPLLTMR